MIVGGGYITACAVLSEIRHSASENAFGSEISLARCEMFLRNVKEENASVFYINLSLCDNIICTDGATLLKAQAFTSFTALP